MQIRRALDEYYQDCLSGITLTRRSPRTINNYRSTWGLFLKLIPIYDCLEITDIHLRQFFKIGEQERKWTSMTTRTHRKNISVFINWCISRCYMRQYPLKNIPKPPLSPTLPKYYEQDRIEAILYAIEIGSNTAFERIRNKAIIAVGCMTGLRRGELLALRLSDLDLINKVVRVQASTSKSRKERYVPIPLKLYKVLTDYISMRNQSAAVGCVDLWVSSTTGNKLSHEGLKHITEKLSKQLGFRLKMHSLRHSYGTFSYSGSHDIVSVQQNMGHSDLNTTMKYVAALSQDKHDTAELNPMNNLF